MQVRRYSKIKCSKGNERHESRDCRYIATHMRLTLRIESHGHIHMHKQVQVFTEIHSPIAAKLHALKIAVFLLQFVPFRAVVSLTGKCARG